MDKNKETGMAPIPILSSDSVENGQLNVRKSLGYDKGYFAYAKIGTESAVIRYYSSCEEAYNTVLKQTREIQSRTRKDAYILVCDNSRKKIHEGTISKNGKLTLYIYGGETVSFTTLENKIKYKTKMTTRTNSTEATNELSNAASNTTENIFQKYKDAGLVTDKEYSFLKLEKNTLESIAWAVQEAAIKYRLRSEKKFHLQIDIASRYYFSFSTKKTDGTSLDNNHVSFKDIPLYNLVHCNSPEDLLNGKKCRVPGKIALNKIALEIGYMYLKGKEIMFGEDQSENLKRLKANAAERNRKSKKTTVNIKPKSKAKIPPTHNTKETACDALPKSNGSIISNCKRNLTELSLAVTTAIMLRLNTNDDVLSYLKYKGVSLDTDLHELTNGIVSASIKGKQVSITVLDSVSSTLSISDHENDVNLRKAISATVSHCIIEAMLSNDTQQSISAVVESKSIIEYYHSVVMKNAMQNYKKAA